MVELGYSFQEVNEKHIVLTRKTRESEIKVEIRRGEDRIEYSFDTGIDFLNHMLETVVWRSGFNIDASFRSKGFSLTHVVCEDIGLCMGLAFAKLVEILTEKEGVEGKGAAINGIDEALALAFVSFEGRSGAYFELDSAPGALLERVEDARSWDIRQFFDGFAQGARATVHIRSFAGMDPHHSWEAIFRAFGEALKEAFSPNPLRKGSCAGVKGTLD